MGFSCQIHINKLYNEIENALKNTKSDIIDDGTGLKEGYFNINAFKKKSAEIFCHLKLMCYICNVVKE